MMWLYDNALTGMSILSETAAGETFLAGESLGDNLIIRFSSTFSCVLSTDSIPAELGKLVKLEVLRLGINSLTGKSFCIGVLGCLVSLSLIHI